MRAEAGVLVMLARRSFYDSLLAVRSLARNNSMASSERLLV